MRSRRNLLVGGALGLFAVIAVLIVVLSMVKNVPEKIVPPQPPVEALTPEESTVTVRPQADGTLHITQRLVFDAPDGSDKPLIWAIGGIGIGWESKDRHAQYAVMPSVSRVAGVELNPDTGLAEADALTISRDDSAVEDEFYDDVIYRFSPAPVDGGPVVWEPGRHSVEIEFVLSEVHVRIGAKNMFLVPLRFPHAPMRAQSMHTLTVEHGTDSGENGPRIECLPDNVVFAPDPDCSGLGEGSRLSEDATTLQWSGDNLSSIEAIAFAAPESVTAVPRDVHRQEQR